MVTDEKLLISRGIKTTQLVVMVTWLRTESVVLSYSVIEIVIGCIPFLKWEEKVVEGVLNEKTFLVFAHFWFPFVQLSDRGEGEPSAGTRHPPPADQDLLPGGEQAGVHQPGGKLVVQRLPPVRQHPITL